MVREREKERDGVRERQKKKHCTARTQNGGSDEGHVQSAGLGAASLRIVSRATSAAATTTAIVIAITIVIDTASTFATATAAVAAGVLYCVLHIIPQLNSVCNLTLNKFHVTHFFLLLSASFFLLCELTFQHKKHKEKKSNRRVSCHNKILI